jgi:LacI family transcriptional regulator
VSRCLNNHPSVSHRTREKVLSVVKRLNYHPHTHAQRLASQKSNTVSVIIPFFTNYFFVQVLQGLQDRAEEMGMDLILYGVNHTAEVEQYLRRSLMRGHVDGVLFFSMRLPETYAAKFQQMELPLVIVDGYHPLFDSIKVKNLEGATEATRHLLRLGHRSVAMINASPETLPAQERLAGYRRALEEFGVEYRPDLVVVSGVGKQDGYHRDGGRDSMRKILAMMREGSGVTAVFVASDIQAIGALEAIRETGLRVPDDIAIVSFDDIDLARHAELTTMRQPMYDMGMLAMEKLAARMKSPFTPPGLTTFMPDLIVRRSCGALGFTPGADAGAAELVHRL